MPDSVNPHLDARSDFQFVIYALLAFFLVLLLVSSPAFRVLFAFAIFFVILLLVMYLSHREDLTVNGLRVPRCLSHGSLSLYSAGALASLLVVLVPAPKYSITTPLTTFMSMPPISFTRIISGYFFLSVFPGLVMYECFLKNRGLQTIEKVGIVISLSYAISIVIGLAVKLVGKELNPFNITIGIWLYALFIKAISHLSTQISKVPSKVRVPAQPISENRSQVRVLELGLLITAFGFMLFSAYMIVLLNEPTDFALAYDIARYVEFASGFLFNHPVHQWANYIWPQFFIAEASALTGLHPVYAYTGLQYLILLLPIGVYSLLRAISPKNDKAPVIGAVATSVLGGLSAIGIFDVYFGYTAGSVWTSLNLMDAKIGLRMLPNYLFAVILDFGIALLAAAYAFKYIESEKKDLTNLFIGALLFNTSIFSHNMYFGLGLLTTLFVYSIFSHKFNRMTKILALSAGFFVFFNVLSDSFFSNFIFNYYVIAFVLYTSQGFVPKMLIGFGVASLILVLFFIFSKSKLQKLESLKSSGVKILKRPIAKMLFPIISFIIFVLAVIAWRADYPTLFISRLDDLQYIFPWYVFVLNFFGIYLLITVASIPYLVSTCDRKPLAFIATWMLSMAMLGTLGIVAPSFFPPLIWVNGFFGTMMMFPLMFLTALVLSSVGLSFNPNFQVRRKKAMIQRFFWLLTPRTLRSISCLSLTVLITISFLTYAYTVEKFYAGSYASPSLSTSEADAYRWIYENTPKDAVIFTYSYYMSHLRLGSLTGRVVVSYELMSLGKPWPLNVALHSLDPELILYSLSQMGVNYIFLTTRDVNSMEEQKMGTMLSLIKVLPVVYNSSDVTIYKVPPYPVHANANYILVTPTLDFSADFNETEATVGQYQTIFDMLIASNLNFTTVQDVDVNSFEANNVYIFPSNMHLSNFLYNDIPKSVSKGTDIVFTNADFATYDELSSPRKNVFLNSLDIRTGELVNASSITFSGSYSIDVGNLEFPRLVVDDPNLEVMANYTSKSGIFAPYITRKAIDNGSITFVYLDPVITSNRLKSIDLRNLFQVTLTEAMSNLPKPHTSSNLKLLPYPSDLFKLLFPTSLNIYNLRGLDGYILSYEDMNFSGNVTVRSDFVLWSEDYLPFVKVIFTNSTGSIVLENGTIMKLLVKGNAEALFEAGDLIIYNIETIKLTRISFSAPLTARLSLKNGATATISIYRNGTVTPLELSQGDLKISIGNQPKTVQVRLKQPTISLSGKINTTWEGAFWHKGLLYSTVIGPQPFPIEGTLCLQVLYCPGTILSKIISIVDISIIV